MIEPSIAPNIRVDAAGYSCPQPMLMASDALRTASENSEVVVLVSDAASRESVVRLAAKLGRACTCKETEEGLEVTILGKSG